MKRLFNQNDKYIPEAMDLDTEASKLLRDLFKRWASAGFSVRDISHVVHGAVTEAELTTVLGFNKKGMS